MVRLHFCTLYFALGYFECFMDQTEAERFAACSLFCITSVSYVQMLVQYARWCDTFKDRL